MSIMLVINMELIHFALVVYSGLVCASMGKA